MTISERALLARINRKLTYKNEVLRKTRGLWYSDLGDYYIMDYSHNIVAKYINLEELGRQLECLDKSETIEVN